MGPARCQVCFAVTRFDDSTPILICDLCDEEAHLTCLGLAAVPAEDHWHCPHCAKAGGKKKAPHKGRDDDDDEAYRPDPSLRRQLAAQSAQAGGPARPLGVHAHQAAAMMGLRRPVPQGWAFGGWRYKPRG